MPGLVAITGSIELSESSRGSVAVPFTAPAGVTRRVTTADGDVAVCHATRKSLPSKATSRAYAFAAMRNVADCCGASAERKVPNIEAVPTAGSYADHTKSRQRFASQRR